MSIQHFFGSIQIVQYLTNNSIELKGWIWFFAAHSNNPEIIKFLENRKIKPQSFEEVFFYESIKCNNYQMTLYIMENYL